jgi:sugar lactone lactonase YvrE
MPDRKTELLADGFHFLEGPRWRDGALWMSDIGAKTVVRLRPGNPPERVIDLPGTPSGLGFLPDGAPLVVSVNERTLYRIVEGRLAPHADLSSLVSSPVNDMVVDDRGRAYVGCMGYDFFQGAPAKPGSILMAEPGGAARIVAEDLSFPNGMVITSQGRLVVGESFASRLTSFAIAADGSLSDRRVELDLGGTPDGICLDVEDGIWVALLEQGFARVKDGRIVERVGTIGARAIACQLGGDDGRTLFCLTFNGAVGEIAQVPGASVETVRVDVPGAGSP